MDCSLYCVVLETSGLSWPWDTVIEDRKGGGGHAAKSNLLWDYSLLHLGLRLGLQYKTGFRVQDISASSLPFPSPSLTFFSELILILPDFRSFFQLELRSQWIALFFFKRPLLRLRSRDLLLASQVRLTCKSMSSQCDIISISAALIFLLLAQFSFGRANYCSLRCSEGKQLPTWKMTPSGTQMSNHRSW